MDFAPNGTLRERHPRGSILPIGTVSSYVKQVAEALQYAHDEKLIHRDIKPENMLLARNNSVLLSDFGIATVAHRSSTQNTSIIAGTAVYMSPELFRGKSYPASDQYALGVVVYEWLCGEPPFYEGDFIQLGYQHTYVPPEPLSEKTHLVSKDVEHIVNIALAKDPKQRFGSVQAFANAFEQASQSKQGNVPPIRPTPLPTPTPTPTPPMAVATEEYKPPVERISITSTDNHEGDITSNEVVQPKPVTEVPAKRSENPWRIGKSQWLAMLIGSVIFGILNYGIDLLFYSSSPLSSPFLPTYISFSSLLYNLLILLPLFLGSIYGPWVSLVIFLVSGYTADAIAHATSNWDWYAGTAIIGFIVGLALIRTKGNYASRRARLTACFICVLAVFVGYGFFTINEVVVFHASASDSWNSFFSTTLPSAILTLILLPLLLSFYNKRVSHSGNL